MNDVESRLRRLERANRWLVIGLAVAVVAVAAMGATKADVGSKYDFRGTITARGFRLVDDAGKVWGEFGSPTPEVPENGVKLFTNHPNGLTSFWFSDVYSRPELMIYPANGKAKANLGIDRDGNGFLRLMDKDHKPMIGK